VTDEQQAELRGRVNQVQGLLNAIEGAWAPLARELARMRAEKVESLVTENNEQTRGAVKQIDEVLQLPNNLREELLSLINSLPETGEASRN
jgi:type VI protein secretion system component VasF